MLWRNGSAFRGWRIFVKYICSMVLYMFIYIHVYAGNCIVYNLYVHVFIAISM